MWILLGWGLHGCLPLRLRFIVMRDRFCVTWPTWRIPSAYKKRAKECASFLEWPQRLSADFFPHPGEIFKGRETVLISYFESENIHGGFDEVFLPKEVDAFATQTVYQGATGDEMLQFFLGLRCAIKSTRTACGDLPLFSKGMAVAYRAGLWEVKRCLAVRFVGVDHAHYLGDDIPCPLDHHMVAHADVLAFQFIGIMERCSGDHHAPNGDGFQLCHRRQDTRASHLDCDILEKSFPLLCGEFMGQSPPRRTRHKARLLLLFKGVDLINYPVNVISQTSAPGADILIIGEKFWSGLAQANVFGQFKPPGV